MSVMEIKCICNDNRGTDCDYCGGTGWIIDKVTLGGLPPKKAPAPSPRDKLLKRKKNVSKVKRSKSEAPKQPIKASKTIEERIGELTDELNQIKVRAREDTIINLGEQLKKLYFDIKKFEPTLKKRKRTIYNNALRRSIALIRLFDNKFEKHRLLE